MPTQRACRPNSTAWPKTPSEAAIGAAMARHGLGYVQALRLIQGRQIIRGRR